MKKLQITFTSILLTILLILGAGLLFNNTKKAISAKAADFTEYTAQEIIEENNAIDQAYLDIIDNVSENEITTNTSSMSLDNSDNALYYITKDTYRPIDTNFANGKTIFILLNGYSLSGNFFLKLSRVNVNTKVYILDRLPTIQISGKTNYNPNPDKYYTYNSSTGKYSTYSTTKPNSGTDVTNMPTFTSNTYIHVRGGAISPNNASSGNSSNMTFQIWSESTDDGKFCLQKVNIVGVEPYNENSLLLANISIAGFYLYQCNIIGNTISKGNSVIYLNGSCEVYLKGCKVFGNKLTSGTNYLTTANSANLQQEAPIVINHSSSLTLNLYKSNIVGLANSSNYTKAVYTKDLNITGKSTKVYTFTNNFVTELADKADMEGTLELVKSCELDYTAVSPNLNIVDLSSGGNKTGDNLLTIKAGAQVKKITKHLVVPSGGYRGYTKIYGTVDEIAADNLGFTLYSGGRATVEAGATVKEITNYGGSLRIEGTVTTLKNSTLTSNPNEDAVTTIAGNANVTTATSKNGKLIIESGTIDTLTNEATVRVTGSATINNFTNQATGTVDIAQGGNVATLTNEGTINLAGTIGSFIFTSGTLRVTSQYASMPAQLTIPAAAEFAVDKNVYFSTSIQVVNNGTATIAGTIESLEGGKVNIQPTGRVVLPAGKVIDSANNQGELEILGEVKTLEQVAGQTSVAGKITSADLTGGDLEITSTNADLPVSIRIPKGASLTIPENTTINTEIINLGTVNINGIAKNLKSDGGTLNVGENGSLQVLRGVTIESLISKGNIEIAGVVKNLNIEGGRANIIGNAQINAFACNAGDTTIESSAVSLPAQITIGRAAIARVLKDVAIGENVAFNVLGTLVIEGSVANFEGLGKVEIAENTKITVQSGKSIATIENAGELTVQNNAVVTNLTNNGTLFVNSGAKVTYITSKGTTTIDGKANISTLIVLDGTTTVNNNAVVNRAETTGGSLTVAENARVKTITKSGGSVLDYRKSNMWLFITLIIAGVLVLVALAIILPLTIKRKKKSNTRNGVVSNRYKDRLEHAQYVAQKRLVLNKANALKQTQEPKN